MRTCLIVAALFASAVSPAFAQTRPAPAASATPKPTKVVARSGRLVTARTSNGGTQSFNCKKPSNKNKAVCRR